MTYIADQSLKPALSVMLCAEMPKQLGCSEYTELLLNNATQFQRRMARARAAVIDHSSLASAGRPVMAWSHRDQRYRKT